MSRRVDAPMRGRRLQLLRGLALAGVVAQVFTVTPRAQSAAPARPELVLQTGHTGPITAIVISPDGRFVVSGSEDARLKIWDVASGNVLRTLTGHTKPVLTAAISSDGRLIASGGEDDTVRVWNVVTGDMRVVGSHSAPVRAVAFSADSRQLISVAAPQLKVWDVGASRQLREVTLIEQKNLSTSSPEQFVLGLSADGRLAAIAGGVDVRTSVLGFGSGIKAKPIRVIDTTTGRDIDTFRLEGKIPTPSGLRFSPDGRMLAVKYSDANAPAKENATGSPLSVFDVGTGRVIKTAASGDGSKTGGIEFSPDGKLLAARVNFEPGLTTNDATAIRKLAGSIKLFDVVTWKQVGELANTGPDFGGGLRGAAPLSFSRDGKLIAASLGDGVALFETASGNRIRLLRTTEKTSAISSAPTNQPSQDELLRQAGFPIDANQMRSMMSSIGGIQSAMFDQLRPRSMTSSDVNFAPDGKLLSVTGSKTVWDLVAGIPRTMSENTRSLPFMIDMNERLRAFSPDGKLSAETGLDPGGGGAIVIVRDIPSGNMVQTIALPKTKITLSTAGNGRQAGASARVTTLAFSSRGVVVEHCEMVQSSGFMGIASECHVTTYDTRTGKTLRDITLENSRGDMGAFFNMQPSAALSSTGRLIGRVRFEDPKMPKGPGPSRFGNFGGIGGIGGVGERGPAIASPLAPKHFAIEVSELDSGRKLWETKHDNEWSGTPTLMFSPNDAMLVVTVTDKSGPVLILFDAMSGRVVRSIPMAERTVHTLSFSRDSRMMALTFEGDSSLFGRSLPSPTAKFRQASNLVSVYETATGRLLYEVAHDVSAKGAAFSPDGRLLVTSTEDRNLYVWDERTGEKLATIINLETAGGSTGKADWLIVTPDGLFDGSPAAWQQIMWRFSDNTFDVGPVESFFNELYYPGLAGEIFAGRRPTAVRDLRQLDRRQPTVTFGQPPAEAMSARQYAVHLEVAEAPADASHTQGSGARDVRLFRNGTLVKVWTGDVLGGRSRTTLDVTLPIVAGENRLTAYAFNRDNVKSADVAVMLTGAQTLARKGVAYVLVVGVDAYENSQYNLKFAGADAAAFADEVKIQQEKLERFDRVEVIRLLDNNATKAHLLMAISRLAGTANAPDAPPEFAGLAPAQPEDAVIIYFAGHGTANGERFYLVPHDLGYAGARTGVDAKAIETILAHSVSDQELEAAVQGLDAQQVVLVIDACNSGQALESNEKRRGPMNSKGLAQLAYEKGMYILTAAQSYQAALEASQLGHGYLTYALVEEGLKKGMARADSKDGVITVRTWFDYATARVPEMQQQNVASRLLQDADNAATDPNAIRNLQSPRAFYRRDAESIPVVIAKP